MGRVLLRRVLGGAATLLLATLIFHAAVTLLPGDPIRAIWGPTRPPEDVLAQIRAQYRLDDPYPMQYAAWLQGLLRGDLGTSYPRAAVGAAVTREGGPVAGMLAGAAPVSIRLLGAAMVLHVLCGVATGTAAVLVGRGARNAPRPWLARAGAAVDRLTYGGAVVAVAAPTILLAYVGQVVFGHRLGWLPIHGIVHGWTSYVLPCAAMSLPVAGYVVLVTRRELLQTLRDPFVTTAVANGVPRRRVIVVHALRVSLVPVITLAAANLGLLVAAQIIVEGVYGLPGLGGLVFDAIQRHDRALLVPAVTVITAVVIVANVVADVLATIADPRLRVSPDGG